MHFHRDMLAICDSYARHVLRAEPTDRFTGSPPLAFTFGLGGLVLFPLRIGASTVLLEKAGPDELLDAIAKYKITIPFTAPTAYRAMLGKLKDHDISSLRKCVSAGETLAEGDVRGLARRDRHQDSRRHRRDRDAAHLHRLARARGARRLDRQAGAGLRGLHPRRRRQRVAPPGTVGRLAVRGPTGCRYLADDRQRKYVQNGWNVTGDTYLMDADGYFWYQARSDDMIISAGYNIAGPEVEAALLTHAAVAECGVVGAPDEERGQIVKAYVVLRAGQTGDAAMTKQLAGSRQGRDRALQVSARHRIRHRAAEDADRQAAALRIAPPRRRKRRAQARIIRRMPVPARYHSETAHARRRSTRRCSRRAGRSRRATPTASRRAASSSSSAAWSAGTRSEKFPKGFVAQARQALENIAAVLAEGGARPEHIVRLTWYVLDMDEYLAARTRARRGLSRGAGRPLPGDGAGPGRPAVRAGGAARDRGDGG